MISWRAYHIIPERCKRCEACLKSCPTGAIKKPEIGAFQICQQKCTRCGACVEQCFLRAIGTHFSPKFIQNQETISIKVN